MHIIRPIAWVRPRVLKGKSGPLANSRTPKGSTVVEPVIPVAAVKAVL